MTKSNCSSCGIEIETRIHPKTKEGHMCFDCHADYIFSKLGVKLSDA